MCVGLANKSERVPRQWVKNGVLRSGKRPVRLIWLSVVSQLDRRGQFRRSQKYAIHRPAETIPIHRSRDRDPIDAARILRVSQNDASSRTLR
jgi:hypothetical protein